MSPCCTSTIDFSSMHALKNFTFQLFAPLDIGLVVTCPFDPDSGKCGATIATATPIANSLGLTVDTSWLINIIFFFLIRDKLTLPIVGLTRRPMTIASPTCSRSSTRIAPTPCSSYGYSSSHHLSNIRPTFDFHRTWVIWTLFSRTLMLTMIMTTTMMMTMTMTLPSKLRIYVYTVGHLLTWFATQLRHPHHGRQEKGH